MAGQDREDAEVAPPIACKVMNATSGQTFTCLTRFAPAHLSPDFSRRQPPRRASPRRAS